MLDLLETGHPAPGNEGPYQRGADYQRTTPWPAFLPLT